MPAMVPLKVHEYGFPTKVFQNPKVCVLDVPKNLYLYIYASCRMIVLYVGFCSVSIACTGEKLRWGVRVLVYFAELCIVRLINLKARCKSSKTRH